MKPLTIDEVIRAVDGTPDRPAPVGTVNRVETDSRNVATGDLFVAIRGERFDGHDFVPAAFEAGAVAALVHDDYEVVSGGGGTSSVLPAHAVVIRVDDTVAALGRLGQYYRRHVIGGSVTVVSVTGSNGKTTTKSMIAHILSQRWRGKASIKSFNNAIGVPLTLLSVEPSDEFVVCEVGTNAPGEIAALSRLVEPEIAAVIGISEAHLEGLGSLHAIAEEKMSMLRHLRPDGCGVVNADYDMLRHLLRKDYDLRKLKCVTFGRWEEADLRLTDLQVVTDTQAQQANLASGETLDGLSFMSLAFTINDRFQYRLNTPGRHNVFNALAAIGVARRFGMDHDEIASALASFSLPPMRLQYEKPGRLTVINDAYNANPASLSAAVEVLRDMPAKGRRVLVVGDMLELGDESERLHREAAKSIARHGIDLVVTVGENAKLMAREIAALSDKRIETHAYQSAGSAKRRLLQYLKPTDTILFKGSRAIGLELLVDQVREWATKPKAGLSKKRGSASKQPNGAKPKSISPSKRKAESEAAPPKRRATA